MQGTHMVETPLMWLIEGAPPMEENMGVSESDDEDEDSDDGGGGAPRRGRRRHQDGRRSAAEQDGDGATAVGHGRQWHQDGRRSAAEQAGGGGTEWQQREGQRIASAVRRRRAADGTTRWSGGWSAEVRSDVHRNEERQAGRKGEGTGKSLVGNKTG